MTDEIQVKFQKACYNLHDNPNFQVIIDYLKAKREECVLKVGVLTNSDSVMHTSGALHYQTNLLQAIQRAMENK
jgi:hypothetical protein